MQHQRLAVENAAKKDRSLIGSTNGHAAELPAAG